MRKWQTRALIGVAVCSCLVGVAWIVLNPRHHDPYPFLSGHPIVDVGVDGPGTWSATEVRVYSWKQPWQTVSEAAKRELPRFGMTKRRRPPKWGPGADWVKGPMYGNGLEGFRADLMLEITPGRTRELRSYGANNDANSEWVTVTVMNVVDDNWLNIMRYTLFPLRD